MSDNGDNPKRKAVLDRAAKRFKLTAKQRVFADAIASDPERNQTKAAKVAKAANPSMQGSKWMSLDKVASYLQEIASLGRMIPSELDNQEQALLDVPKVERYLASHAMGSMGDFIDIEEGDTYIRRAPRGEGGIEEVKKNYPVFNFVKAQDRGVLHLIKKLKIKAGFTPEGLPWTETDLELYDSDKAVDTWLKLHGLYKDGAEAPRAMDAVWAAVLSRLPPAVLRAMDEARLSGQPIDVPALVVGGGNGGVR